MPAAKPRSTTSRLTKLPCRCALQRIRLQLEQAPASLRFTRSRHSSQSVQRLELLKSLNGLVTRRELGRRCYGFLYLSRSRRRVVHTTTGLHDPRATPSNCAGVVVLL